MSPWALLSGRGCAREPGGALLSRAPGAGAAGLPFYAILCLPVLFAAGMSLLDTIDGSFMNFAYGWAFSKPVRKVYYNLTITGLSVAVAFIVGTIELLSIAGVVSNVDMNVVGFVIVGLFVTTWSVALAVWRFTRIADKWAEGVRS